MTDGSNNVWRNAPPDSEGFWWLYGEEEFGSMGGDYDGTFKPDMKLRIVEVIKISNGLVGSAGGRMISLTPFNKEKRKPGYIGLWQKTELPEAPNTRNTEL